MLWPHCQLGVGFYLVVGLDPDVKPSSERGEQHHEFLHSKVHPDAHARPPAERHLRMARPAVLFGARLEPLWIETQRIVPKLRVAMQRVAAEGDGVARS